MKQPIDALVAFDQGASYPRPVRIKLMENGVKKSVDVCDILHVKALGAGGMLRYEFVCRSNGSTGPIQYRLMYYYTKNLWEIETDNG